MSADSSPLDEQQSNLTGLRDRFPGYFPPDGDQVKDFITYGMVAFDTNALFDVYRFNEQARAEYLASLHLLSNRLWIPNRVGQELLERRLTIIKECSTAGDVLATDLSKAFGAVIQILREFGNRRGLSRNQIAQLEDLATRTRDEITESAADFYSFGLKLDESLKGDPILQQLDFLLDGKVGPPLLDVAKAEAEALKRLEAEIPPGYRDWRRKKAALSATA
jgi:hypothetical protein